MSGRLSVGGGSDRRRSVIQCLRTGRTQRTALDVQMIRDFIAAHCRSILFQNMTTANLDRLCRSATLQTCQASDIVVQQGSPSETIIVLLRGRCDVYCQDDGKTVTNPNEYRHRVTTIDRPGSIIGEINIAENAKCNVTVVAAVDETALLLIDAVKGRSIMKQQMKNDQQDRIRQIATLIYFNFSNNDDFIRDLSRMFRWQTLRRREVLVRQGVAVDEVQFLIGGHKPLSESFTTDHIHSKWFPCSAPS